MNINRNNNNNRRRSRGNNRAPGGGNGPGNRIDSRSRGNAPQMLEKYRKLAHDASMNDDRVQTEYYLQFADHYFRVLADSRSPKDEARGRRDFDREQGEDEDQEGEFDGANQPYTSQSQTREAPAREALASQPSANAPQAREGQRRETQPAQPQERSSRERAPREPRNRDGEGAVPAEEGHRGVEGESEASVDADPFILDTRSRRPRTRSRVQAPVEQATNESGQAESSENAGSGDGVDPAVLPPSIVRSEPDPVEEQPARARAPRTRTRRPRPADNGDAETLEAVS